MGNDGIASSKAIAGLALACLVLALHPGAAAPQGPVSSASAFPAPQQEQPDSAALLDRAHDAQRRFERIRRRHLPWSWGSYGGPCDERVGRMCWHYDDPEDDWTKPEDPEQLVRAREALVDTLTALLSEIPGDRWVLGQLVWYLGEGGHWNQAEQVARGCPGADYPWCAALRGLALHGMGEHVEAARSFEAAGGVVDEMGGDAEEDLRVLLDDTGRDVRDGNPASAVGLDFDALFWLLADPMYLVAGNDRQTEHEARRVVNRLRTGARNPYALAWGKDMSELVVRYGWAEAWERVRGYSGTTEPLGIVGRHPARGRRFLPSGKTLVDPTAVVASDLDPVDRRPRTTYNPTYTSVLRSAAAEVFALDRGDSVLILAAFADSSVADAMADTITFQQGAFAADLVSGGIVSGVPAGPGAWKIRVANRPQLVSVEHLPDGLGVGRRFRKSFELGPRDPGVVGLSELMMLDGGAAPNTLDDVVRTLRSAIIRPGQTVTVAWEVYGLGFDESALGYDLSVAREDGGILAAVGDWIGLGDGEKGLLIDWTEAQPTDPGPQLRFVSLTFPPLEEGTYTLSLALQLAGRSAVVETRKLIVSASR